MKTTIRTLAAAAVLAITAIGTASANPGDGWQRSGFRPQPLAGLHEINMRQQAQHHQIEQGVNRGLITRFEFRRLMAEQGEIRRFERAYVADGFLAPHERMDLTRRLDIAQRNIAFEARDHQRRF